jgi:hypothetical protein
VRTVQRWEFTHKMPVYRPTKKMRSAVTAFTDEIEAWIGRTDVNNDGYIRPIIIMLDRPDPHRLTNRKLALEIEKFNVLTAYSLDELFATAERADYDGIVMSCAEFDDFDSLCRLIKEQFPNKPLLVLAPNGERPEVADYVVPTSDDLELVGKAVSVFGKPKLA